MHAVLAQLSSEVQEADLTAQHARGWEEVDQGLRAIMANENPSSTDNEAMVGIQRRTGKNVQELRVRLFELRQFDEEAEARRAKLQCLPRCSQSQGLAFRNGLASTDPALMQAYLEKKPGCVQIVGGQEETVVTLE
jgi:hypothetical protein